MAVQIQLRNDTAANWTAANPTLAVGEMGIETDTDKFKIGDGTTAWTSLAYGGIQGPAGADGADGNFSSTQTISSVSTSRALTSADVGKLLTNSGAVTITVEALTTGQQVDFLQLNSSQITFTAGSGVTLYSKDSKLKTAAQYSPASIKCIGTNTYVLIGDLGA